MPEIITLHCDNCGKEFDRLAKEHRRCQKRALGVACGRSCGATLRNRKCPSKGNPQFLIPGNRLDALSPFRFVRSYTKSKAVQREIVHTVTLEEIAAQWKKQDGICPYTGYAMKLSSPTTKYQRRESSPYIASLDRIDSSKGYEPGNIEFVCMVVNYAKNDFDRDTIMAFFAPLRKESTVIEWTHEP